MDERNRLRRMAESAKALWDYYDGCSRKCLRRQYRLDKLMTRIDDRLAEIEGELGIFA